MLGSAWGNAWDAWDAWGARELRAARHRFDYGASALVIGGSCATLIE